MTERQYRRIEEIARKIRNDTGFRITRASIMLKLMELGLPALEQEFEIVKEHSKIA